jgi:hypothetical protein
MAAPKQRRIDWGGAQIEDATLTVGLTGAGSKAWKERFESVLALLDSSHSRWGEVRVVKNAIEVTDVQRGTESELRHLLESIVLQVNSELPEQEPEPETQVDEAAQADRRMTVSFRAFADD